MNPWVRVLIIFFLGGLGVHKFVDKQTGMGILYLLTGGLFGIGWLVDLVKAIIAAVNSEDESTHAVSANNPNAFAIVSEDCKFYPYESTFVDGQVGSIVTNSSLRPPTKTPGASCGH